MQFSNEEYVDIIYVLQMVTLQKHVANIKNCTFSANHRESENYFYNSAQYKKMTVDMCVKNTHVSTR